MMPKKFWEELGTLSCCVKDNHVMLTDHDQHGDTSYHNSPPLDTSANSPSPSLSLHEDTSLLLYDEIDSLPYDNNNLLDDGENLFLIVSNDIIVDILGRLDIKSALQCGRVCRLFYEMISTPSNFIAMHLFNRDTPILVVQCDSLSSVTHDHNENYTYRIVLHFIDGQGEGRILQATSIDINLKYPPGNFHMPRLIGSYNGLLLFRHYVKTTNALFIINPITREQVRMNAQKKYKDCGLYFHTPTSEYRILYMLSYFTSSNTRQVFFVFSLRSKLYREISSYSKAPRTCTPPVILDGRLHWMASIPGSSVCSLRDSTSCSESILVFNMISEGFITMPHPGSQCSSNERHGISMRLSEMAGHLCLFDNSMDTAKLFVWVLEDYKQQVWVKRYTIDIEVCCYKTIPKKHNCMPFADEALKFQNDRLLLRMGYRDLKYYNVKLRKLGELKRGSKEFMNSVVVHNKSANTDRLVSWEEPVL